MTPLHLHAKNSKRAIHALVFEHIEFGEMSPARKPTATIACGTLLGEDWRKRTTTDPLQVTCRECAAKLEYEVATR